MVEAFAVGVFVFVALVVGGWRAIDTLNAHWAKKAEAERKGR